MAELLGLDQDRRGNEQLALARLGLSVCLGHLHGLWDSGWGKGTLRQRMLTKSSGVPGTGMGMCSLVAALN